MPNRVVQIFNSLNIEINGPVDWGTTIENYNAGIYIVSSSPNPEEVDNLNPQPRFDDAKIREWMRRADDMTIDGKKVTLNSIKERLFQFWLPDENILYIGQTNEQTLRKRTRQYYNQKIGKSSPHSGGFWLMTLANLNDLYIYYGNCPEPKKYEINMQKQFMNHVSSLTMSKLRDKDLLLPFANVNYRGKNKKHGFKNHKV
jgi:hypothetical protein